MERLDKNYLLPISIDMRITNKCNMQCSFCFGTSCSNECCIEELCDLIDRLWLFGVRVLVITGGEPTLYPNIIRLLSYAKNKGFKIVLSTNGTTHIHMDLLQYVDALSLPIDGEDYISYKEMRALTYAQFLDILKTMKAFKKTFPDKVLKIGTVVTQKNMDNISGIFHLIKDYADVWKLYQVSMHEKNKEIYNTLEVSDSQFEEITDSIRKLCIHNVKLETYRNNNRNGKYLFCEPNLDAVVIVGNKEVTIGNFKSDFTSLLEEWKKYIDCDLLEDNVKKTYPFITN